MLTYKNETESDVKITTRPTDPEGLPTEVLVKAGETYDVPSELEADFLRWMMDAKAQDSGTPENENESDNNNEVSEDPEKDESGTSKTQIVKNNRDFDIEVTYKDGEDDKTVTVKAGEEIEVPADQVEIVKKQIDEADDSTNDDENEKNDELAEERQALAEERAKIAAERAELQFDKLCESGKVVPAQKESFMALATQNNKAALAEGNNKTVPELLEDFIQSAPAHSLMKEEGKDGEGDNDVELTDEDKQVAEMFGNTEEELKANERK